MKQNDFVHCQTYDTMFIKHFVDEKITLFIVYVNDIIIMGDDDEQVNRLKKLLAKEFKVKDFSTL